MEHSQTTITEHFIENKNFAVSICPWGNLDGVTLSAHQTTKGVFTPIFHASLTWEQADTLIAALALVRAG